MNWFAVGWLVIGGAAGVVWSRRVLAELVRIRQLLDRRDG